VCVCVRARANERETERDWSEWGREEGGGGEFKKGNPVNYGQSIITVLKSVIPRKLFIFWEGGMFRTL
jgi:hypothetical protein